MRSINILAIQRISPDDRAKIEASDPAIRLIDAGGWFEGEIRESWTDFAASRYLPPGATGYKTLGRLAQCWFEVANAQPDQGGFYPVHNPRAFPHQAVALAVRPLGVLFR